MLTHSLPLISTFRFAHDHSLRPVLAPATLAALPSTRAIPDRDVFYVARVPAAPFERGRLYSFAADTPNAFASRQPPLHRSVLHCKRLTIED
jgi:hypothetical protein